MITRFYLPYRIGAQFLELGILHQRIKGAAGLNIRDRFIDLHLQGLDLTADDDVPLAHRRRHEGQGLRTETPVQKKSRRDGQGDNDDNQY